MISRRRLLQLVLLSALLLTAGCSTGGLPVEADLILTNAKVWTVDETRPSAEAVAVWDGKILAVGSVQEIERLSGARTRVIDLQGQLVLPGFIDSHVHFVSGGFHLLGVDLKNAKDEEEFGRLLAEKSKELPPGAWITGGNWDHDKWPSGAYPTAELIDKYVPDRPVLVSRYDGHMTVANSIALRLAGITARTPDPPEGTIIRKSGSMEPAGALRETASGLVSRKIPPSSRAEIRTAIETALKRAAAKGFTSVHQVDVRPVHMDIYQELLDEGKLTARIYGFIPISQRKRLIDLGIKRNFNNDWLALGGVKGFIDGSLGSSTALFFEPYTSEPTTSGMYASEPGEFKQAIIESDKAGLQCAIHAIGDRANAEMLDIFADAIRENGQRDRRFRIEHAQHVRESDFKRFAELGVIASVQPYHAADDGRFAAARIGEERCAETYAFGSFLKNGVTMAFGSDWTVAPLDAILGLDAAVTRRTLDGKNPGGWYPEHKVPVEAAIKAYTLDAAYAAFQEEVKGSITPGKYADLVVLSQDILTIPPDDIVKTEIIYTIAGGRIVYEKK